jgi:hypothetical protein
MKTRRYDVARKQRLVSLRLLAAALAVVMATAVARPGRADCPKNVHNKIAVPVIVLGSAEIAVSLGLLGGGLLAANADIQSGGNGAIGFLIVGAGAVLSLTGAIILLVWGINGNPPSACASATRVPFHSWVGAIGVAGTPGGIGFRF